MSGSNFTSIVIDSEAFLLNTWLMSWQVERLKLFFGVFAPENKRTITDPSAREVLCNRIIASLIGGDHNDCSAGTREKNVKLLLLLSLADSFPQVLIPKSNDGIDLCLV